jgi:hypothetical protein
VEKHGYCLLLGTIQHLPGETEENPMQHLSGEIEENHRNPQSGLSISGLRFETRTSII